MSNPAETVDHSHQPLISSPFALVARSVRSAMSYCYSSARHWYRNYKTRAQLARLPDYILKDIGLKRADAIRETSKPFWR
ncbi:MAG: DUF1127 domain-containing protein [Saccharospirillum sp.]|uniref:DUF1127 domain-containing protein n=1 Tax=Saccharospirillum sp. TaxID=2033801 RepID=UPI003297BA27